MEPFKTCEDGFIEVNTHMLYTRYAYNKVILVIISAILEKYPDWRFQQTLTNIGVGRVEDLFYEESRKTLDLLLENEVVKRFFRRCSKKAEVLDFNEYKGSHKK